MPKPIQECFYCGDTYPAPVGLHHTEEECAEAQARKKRQNTSVR